MPFASQKQKKLMLAVEHNKKFAEKVGIPQRVGRKLVEDDKKAHKKTPKTSSSKRG